MSGLIRISGGASTGGGGSANTAPVIKNFTSIVQTSTTITISYSATDENGTILRHYIYKDGVKTEITDNIIHDTKSNVFKYTITGLNKSTTYKIQIEVSDGLDVARSDILTITTKEHVIYGVRVNEENANPKTRVEYIYDAIDYKQINSGAAWLKDWRDSELYNKFKLVGFKNGKEVKEINPNNKKQYLDGEVVPSDVDVMVKVPKIYWDFKFIDKFIYEIKISEVKFNETCDCYAHKVNGVEKDYIYIGTYLGFEENGKLRSVSDIYPTYKKMFDNQVYAIEYYRNLAHANGNGYQIYNWFSYLLYLILWILFCKEVDIYNGRWQTGRTGVSNIEGMISNKCFLGVEDFVFQPSSWGVLLDGIFLKKIDSYPYIHILLDNSNFNKENMYQKKIEIRSSSDYSYVNTVIGNNLLGFIMDKNKYITNNIKGASNVYYTCRQNLDVSEKSYLTIINENWNSLYSIEYKNTYSYNIFARLVYLGE